MRYQELIDDGLARIRRAGMAEYLDLGAETRAQNRINRAYFESLTFEMRLLGSVESSIATDLLGRRVASPICAAAFSTSRILERLGPWDTPYLELIAGGVADAGSMMTTGSISYEALARVVDLGAPVLHIVGPDRDVDGVLRQLEGAERLGCVGVGMCVDVMFYEKAWDEVPGPEHVGPQSIEQLRVYCEATRLPFVVKGVLSVQDALKARELGAQGIVVSMHGGEAIDYSVPVLEVLPEIRSAVPEMTIFCDSGFRRGTDVLKALTLGADAVGIVTLLVIAVAADGRDGVRTMIELLNEELQRTMSYVGFPNVRELDRSALRVLCKDYLSQQ